MKLYQNVYADFKEMYYANASLGIIASSCLGSIAAMLILMNGNGALQMVELFLVVAVAMWYNASVLSQMKPKFVFNSLILSCTTSLFFIAYLVIALFV